MPAISSPGEEIYCSKKLTAPTVYNTTIYYTTISTTIYYTEIDCTLSAEAFRGCDPGI
ncbi:MAG: hypothetical protein HQK89_17200 [Nitrospirae bacterium]|nr:hypothetical protein [Nitrospirota bacterium]